MNDWWKAPVLQGPENDYGDYDYLVEELPRDYARWEFDKYRWKCDTCGKDSFLRFVAEHYFYCWDGWDGMDYSVCWKCHCKSIIKSSIAKIKKSILKRSRMFNIPAYIAFRRFCKKHNIAKEHREHLWGDYYVDIWADKKWSKMVKGARS
jgi:hypothetical protein